MKSLFKSKPKTPVDLVRQTRDLLVYADLNAPDTREIKREEKMFELGKLLRELKSILYGNSETEPVSEACAQLTQEFFRENTLRLLIVCLPKLNLEARKDATQVVANLQRQQVHSRLIACDYLEKNLDLMDILVLGYENTDMALHYGAMLRECIRHQSVASKVSPSVSEKVLINLPKVTRPLYVLAGMYSFTKTEKETIPALPLGNSGLGLNGEWMIRQLELIREPLPLLVPLSLPFSPSNLQLDVFRFQFTLAADGGLCWKTAGFGLTATGGFGDWIWRKDLGFPSSSRLLGDMLLDRSNSGVMTRYVSSRDNLRILMNLLRESSKSIQIEAFHVFKLFAANQHKPPDIVSILLANRSKLLRLFADFKTDKDSHSKFLAIAVEAAKKAGEVDLVTETDKACEDLIFNHLKQYFPSHQFIGEETTAACGVTELTDEPTWIVDPLDGTTNFVHGFPFVCVSIGLTIGKIPTIGVVYNPIMDELFTGIHGKGAFLNGNPIKVSCQTELMKSLLATEAGTKRDKLTMDATTNRINSLLFKVRSLRMSGSCALNLCGIACGRLDLFYETGFGGPWDVAGGAVIVKEAGGVLFDPSGKEFDITAQRVAASNPLLKDAFIEALLQSE
ncbi:hypothetical protein RHGRI_004274 [Rhododendron griersonianum]|uniref:inositol-phosphate phosphatase n=1 Tax=Rhododendron griersonianum TaxID=479676 RepID=A0AAV6L9T3_9ERIC|nr:hypothetical protein RHGRI_004274 [Rhododendron griersonianum]